VSETIESNPRTPAFFQTSCGTPFRGVVRDSETAHLFEPLKRQRRLNAFNVKAKLGEAVLQLCQNGQCG